MPVQRTWVLTDVGAIQWFGMQAVINRQQETINALVAKVAMVEYQINAPAPTQNLPGGKVV